MQIVRPNQYETYNQWAPGKVTGSDANKPDSIWQVNQGKVDTVNISHAFSFGEPTNQIVAADSNDTVNLMDGDWKAQGYQVDDATGIGGTLYTDDKGNKVLVSGGAEVKTNTLASSTASLTLTTDGNFEKIAERTGEKGTISLEEAQEAYKDESLPQDVRDALKWLTTDGHFEQVAGGSGKEISLEQLQATYNAGKDSRS